MENKYYLRIGRASDLKNRRERILYRLFEIIPGFLSWTTIISCFVFSWLAPFWVAIFITVFDIYWFFKIVYLTFHLRAGYKKMRENMKINWMEKLENDTRKLEIKNRKFPAVNTINGWIDIYHLVILPMYKEDIEVARPSFESLAKNDYPADKMIVVLALEEKSGAAGKKIAEQISREFSAQFFRFLVAIHPSNIEGEIVGKGSNETWAARQAKEDIIDILGVPYENIIVSVFDIDTVVPPGYFACLTYHYLTHPNPTNASFQPIPLFINNIWETPALGRVISFSSTFWHMMQQERPEKQITFSSHSMSFRALVDIGFWQTNVVSEDSRIFWQNFLYYDGNYSVAPLYFSVSMDSNVAPTFWKTIINQYKQMRRWAWGVENIPYTLFGFWRNKNISLRTKLYWAFFQIEGFWSWSTNVLLIFFLGWLPVFLGGGKFNATVLSYNLPFITKTIMAFAMIGMVTSAYLSLMLLPLRPKIYGWHNWIMMALQWLLLPINLIFFGAIPALDAQTRLMLGRYMGFWTTEKARKTKVVKNGL